MYISVLAHFLSGGEVFSSQSEAPLERASTGLQTTGAAPRLLRTGMASLTAEDVGGMKVPALKAALEAAKKKLARSREAEGALRAKHDEKARLVDQLHLQGSTISCTM